MNTDEEGTDNETDEGRCHLLELLPPAVLRLASTFLCPDEALLLSGTCRSLRGSLSLSRLLPARSLCPSLHRTGPTATGGRKHRSYRIPIFNGRVHSVTLSFHWWDQGWGNTKGHVWIAARKRRRDLDGGGGDDDDDAAEPPSFLESDEPFEGRGWRVVYGSPLQSHEREFRRITIVPVLPGDAGEEGEDYFLWYSVGEGGGHRLTIANAMVETLIFDDVDRNVARNYRILRGAGIVPRVMADHRLTVGGWSTFSSTASSSASAAEVAGEFTPKLLLCVCGNLLRQLSNPGSNEEPGDRDTVSFLRDEFDIAVNEASLLAVREIVQAEIDERSRAVEAIRRLRSRMAREAPDGVAGTAPGTIVLAYEVAIPIAEENVDGGIPEVPLDQIRVLGGDDDDEDDYGNDATCFGCCCGSYHRRRGERGERRRPRENDAACVIL